MDAQRLLDGLAAPILQAPMLGASTLEMALAVSGAGGLGAIAAGAMAPGEILDTAGRFRAQSSAPFSVNLLLAAEPRVAPEAVEAALWRLAPWYARLGEPLPTPPARYAADLEAQLDAIVEARPAMASFAFDVLPGGMVDRLHAAGICVMGTATSLAEGRAWAEAGADIICAQAIEAGGHRGCFPGRDDGQIGLAALVPALVQALELPVVAAGGVMDGRGVCAALCLGACAVQMGTAFLLSDESAIAPAWRQAVGDAEADDLRITRVFTGRPARGIANAFMTEMEPEAATIPPYPVQNRLTQPLRQAAARKGEPDALSLWAGQGVGLARSGSAARLVETFWREAQEAAIQLVARTGAKR